MYDQSSPSPNDPFEWLGQGVLMDQSNERMNVANHVEVDPSEMLGQASSSLCPSRASTSQHEDPFEMLPGAPEQPITTLTEGKPNNERGLLIDEKTPEFNNSELIVEDVASIDENQSVASSADDKSYVVQELFPLAKSPKPVGIPTTIYEDTKNSQLNVCSTSVDEPNFAGNQSGAPVYPNSTNQDADLLQFIDTCELTDESASQVVKTQTDGESNVLLSTGGDSRATYQNQSINSFDFVADTQHTANNMSTIAREEHLASSLDVDLFQLSEPLNTSTEEKEPFSLYEAPPEPTSMQQISSLRAVDMAGTDVYTLDLGLPMGSSAPPIRRAESEELSLDRAQSNPSTTATIATVALTAFDDDSDISRSEQMIKNKVNTDKATVTARQVEESYALFNHEDTKPSHVTTRNTASDDEDSLERREECLMSTQKGQKSSLSRGKAHDTSLVLDEENAISPGMVGYTGFDDEESNPSAKKSESKHRYIRLQGNSLTNAKPKKKKILLATTVVLVLLITVISVVISLAMKRAEKSSFSSPNAPSRVDSSNSDNMVDLVENSDNTSEEPYSNTIISDIAENNFSESNTPSSLPSSSNVPTFSLVETASSSTTAPQVYFSSIVLTEPPSKALASGIDTPSTYPSLDSDSSLPSVYASESETFEASSFPTKATPSMYPTYSSTSGMPTMYPTISPSMLNTTNHPSSSVFCSLTRNTSNLPLTWSDEEPCVHFIVDLCIDDIEIGHEWAIVRFLDGYFDDVYYNDDNSRNTSRSASMGLRAYYMDQTFSVTSNESAIVCLGKGLYHFIIHESLRANYYALSLGNGRPIRLMAPGNYTDGIDVTSFEVSDFDIMGIDSNSSLAPLPISQANSAYDYHINTTSLITASGTDLIYNISKAYGVLFDVETGDTPLIFTSIELYLDTSFPVYYEIHSKHGSWKGNELFSGFRVVSHGTIVGGGVCRDETNCSFARIPIEEFEPVYTTSMSRHSFYVTLTTDDLVYHHQDGYGGITYDDKVQISSTELIVFQGASVLKYPLETADPTTDFRPGGFIGRLIYKAGDENTTLGVNDDNITLDETETADECYYYTKEACLNAATNLGLSLGGAGFSFAGDYYQKGCYFYPCSSCLFGGRAYFGMSEDKEEMESTHYFQAERRLNCKTNVDNLHEETSNWCLFPSEVCRSE